MEVVMDKLRFRWLRIAVIYSMMLSIFSPLTAYANDELSLPGFDITAPLIVHDASEVNLRKGIGNVIKATVTDDVEVGEVSLFFRPEGSDRFLRIQMRSGKTKNIYAATLPQLDSNQMEYYIQATDTSGNKVLKGKQFIPLVARISGPTSTIQSTSSDDPINQPIAIQAQLSEETEEKKGISKWVWIGVGVLAVGAVAAAASGGGGGGTDTPPTETSAVTISAPLP